MIKSKNYEKIKVVLTRIFNEYEKNLSKERILPNYLNEKSIDYSKIINLNIDINIKKEREMAREEAKRKYEELKDLDYEELFEQDDQKDDDD